MEQSFPHINQLSDSREVLEARVPRFISFFICFLLVIVLIALAWMWFGEIDEVVRATGVVRPADNISVVRNIVNGPVERIFITDGQLVAKGGLLYEINTESLNHQLVNAKHEYAELDTEIGLLGLLLACIESSVSSLEAELENNARYQLYTTRRNQLELSYLQLEERYVQEERVKSIPAGELARMKSELTVAWLQLEAYIHETQVSLLHEMQEMTRRMRALETQISELEERQSLSLVKAPINGRVQMISSFNPGDYLPGGMDVLRVIPTTAEALRVEIRVRNEDISHIQVGQQVTYRFLALPHREFGVIHGVITNIPSDAGMDVDAMLTYKVDSVLAESILYSRQGTPTAVLAGMITESRIIVRRKKILHFVLAKLDFLA